jgi:pimeloyl-ACP methyl ester carboxylesterase
MPHHNRAPIHLGSGEPILLLHPYLMSQHVWHDVAPMLADTGHYEVFAPTMLGHNGAPRGPFFLDTASMADRVEQQLDELGWSTAHIVGNSLGGWVAFELERRGRARTLTAIAPAGGWTRYAPGKFETIFKFLLLMPMWLLTRALGPRVLSLPFSREIAYPLISASPAGLSETDLIDIVDDVGHCPAYYQLLGKVLALPGLLELADTRAPTHLVICEKDRVFPQSRFSRHFTDHLPRDTRVTTLDGVGHIPMFEAPQRVADLILDFVDPHARPQQASSTA